MKTICEHLKSAKPIAPNTPEGCEECLKIGDDWVELRVCLTCGHVGCCNSSKNKHATKHFEQAKHPVVQSYQSEAEWMWCYVDEVYGE